MQRCHAAARDGVDGAACSQQAVYQSQVPGRTRTVQRQPAITRKRHTHRYTQPVRFECERLQREEPRGLYMSGAALTTTKRRPITSQKHDDSNGSAPPRRAFRVRHCAQHRRREPALPLPRDVTLKEWRAATASGQRKQRRRHAPERGRACRWVTPCLQQQRECLVVLAGSHAQAVHRRVAILIHAINHRDAGWQRVRRASSRRGQGLGGKHGVPRRKRTPLDHTQSDELGGSTGPTCGPTWRPQWRTLPRNTTPQHM